MHLRSKIPATVLTGFLGAGKTSTIRHILQNSAGIRLALIINEFGDLGIDGEIIKEAFPELPNMSLGESIVQDYTATKFSLRAHPLSLLRDILTPSYQSINN